MNGESLAAVSIFPSVGSIAYRKVLMVAFLVGVILWYWGGGGVILLFFCKEGGSLLVKRRRRRDRSFCIRQYLK